MFAKKQT